MGIQYEFSCRTKERLVEILPDWESNFAMFWSHKLKVIEISGVKRWHSASILSAILGLIAITVPKFTADCLGEDCGIYGATFYISL